MKKYLLKRILFSIFSLLVVVMVVMSLVYSAIDRRVIFQTDDTWNKKSNNDRVVYEYVQFEKYGYVDYDDYGTFLKNKYTALYGDSYASQDDYKTDKNVIQKGWEVAKENATVQEFIAKFEGDGATVTYLEPMKYSSGKTKPGGSAALFAVSERSAFLRLWDYIKGFVSIETTDMVDDPELTDRYIRIEKDPYNGFYAVVGSGTFHKYLLYFDGRFPFIHQNWISINLGTSFTTYRGSQITDVITVPRGEQVIKPQQYPLMLGTDEYVETDADFHSLTYNSGIISDVDAARFPDKYTVTSGRRDGLSMLENSFVIGLIATIIQYMFGLPLGILMARRKDKLADKIGNFYIIFIMAVPSMAYIFMFSAIGTKLFGLPNKFAMAEVKVLAYILPTISLALPGIGGLMKWMRRYMIDQMNSDYVKFARAEGLSEQEIYKIHISRNALIPLVHSIPGNVLGCLTGAIITERVYAVPGVGNLLTNAINSHDNGVIVACTVFYTSLSIISVILGDLLMAKYDPRISLSESKGGGR